MKKRLRLLPVLLAIFFMTGSPLAMAHNLWLNPGDYYPKVGSTVDIGIGWGHKYPVDRIDQEVTDDRVAAIEAIDPDGLRIPLKKVSADLYRLPIEKAGAYLITAKIKPGFFTMTPKGRKWGDRKSVADALKCTNFHLEAKTAIIADGNDSHLGHPAGQPLEIIPLSNPLNLKSGDNLPVRVLFDGRPLPNATVRATYAGFEGEHAAQPAAASGGHKPGGKSYPVEATTDDEGRTVLPIGRAGYWMVLISHRPSYPDREVCDEYMYNSDFTFEITSQH